MTIDAQAAAMDVTLEGAVQGFPRLWLQLEGATLMVGALVAYSTTHRSWWLVPLVLFLPDLFMVGYRGGPRVGAHVYTSLTPRRYRS